MKDIKAFLLYCAKAFRDELNEAFPEKDVPFSDSLDLFARLVSNKSYSEMLFTHAQGSYQSLEVPDIKSVVAILNQKGFNVSADNVAKILIQAIGRENIYIYFPFLSRIAANVFDAKTQTIIVNFKDIGLVTSDRIGYYPLGKHNYDGDQIFDAQAFLIALINQDDDLVCKIVKKSDEITSKFHGFNTLEIIEMNYFDNKLAESLVKAIGRETTPKILIEKLNDRRSIEGIIIDALVKDYIHARHTSWECGIGRLFVTSLAEAIDSEIIYFQDEFLWELDNLESIVSCTKCQFLEALGSIEFNPLENL
ncbi:hypothetical protein [Vibrio harveyi]|uniref:hypothetical protein n=1 Tax=Vibrio harveyi TaxID=669 RepID=UPI00069E2432|nr:hypothetical protein [Vibrio harveyi]KNY44643.1 hypothetical protein AKG93_07115 [Vibrio harveyi]